MRGQEPQAAPEEVQLGYEEQFLFRKRGNALAQAARGGGGVTVPVKERGDVVMKDMVSGHGGVGWNWTM